MAKVHIKLSNLILLVLFVLCLNCHNAKSQGNFDSFDFEEMKRDLFSLNDFDISNLRNNISVDEIGKILKCSKELNTIRKALQKKELWALKSEYK